ncbi:PREDICTED: aladin-like [Nicrophorus vespilloides]|uniref:Aladin-like n=1 Tax=Nicrophorus vespilloides TaxID=110193 RepID=A0ABM1MXR8_NICVS|nr:PREDICTED: aladin-like [Nicrophorus vespilloides]
MNSLQDFTCPNDGELTLCEVDGRIHSMNFEFANVNAFTNTIDRHPKIHITRDMLHPVKTMDEGKALFLPVDVPFLKQLIQVYYEQGMMEAIEMVSAHRQTVISASAKVLLQVINKLHKVRCIVNPRLLIKGESTITQFSQTRNWSKSPIRCMAWHDTIPKIAVATSDDTVRIYQTDSTMVPILKCKQQKNVTCIAWRPMSNSDIAVACESGIIVWNVDPNSVVTRPSMNHAIILSRTDHNMILSISWSPRGDVLASVAASDSKVLLWDVELDRTSSLKRAGASGLSLLKWSPDGNKLFVGTTTCVFRVWECNSWLADKWNILAGYVQTACWSKCGTYLLFTSNEEPIIYALPFSNCDFVFKNEVKTTPNQAMPLYDVSKVDIDGVIVGGIVQYMEWDTRGNHVAVLFKDTNCVAVFYVIAQPVLQLAPGFLVSGCPEEVPITINFQPNFDHGSCLTIGWSSGRIQHFPIVYSDFCNTSTNIISQQQSYYDSFNLSNAVNSSTYLIN